MINRSYVFYAGQEVAIYIKNRKPKIKDRYIEFACYESKLQRNDMVFDFCIET